MTKIKQLRAVSQIETAHLAWYSPPGTIPRVSNTLRKKQRYPININIIERSQYEKITYIIRI